MNNGADSQYGSYIKDIFVSKSFHKIPFSQVLKIVKYRALMTALLIKFHL